MGDFMGDYLGKKNIFLIDDDIIFHEIVISILSDKYNVITSRSGNEALILLVKNKPDLILLDIVMPEMDGWEIFHKVRGISTLYQVPIAFVTSLNETEGFDHAKRIGASDYFIKPLDPADFLSRVEKLLLVENEA